MSANERTVVVTGLLGYCVLTAMTRLCKDGDQAPLMKDAVLHAHMADQAFHEFENLEMFAQGNGFDLTEASARFAGLFDELEARTRPSSWWERSLKTYITFGVLGDLLQLLATDIDVAKRELTLDFGQKDWEEEHLGAEIAADPQLAARLSLWGRRVFGDVLGLVRATLFTYPELGLSAEEADQLVLTAEQNHGKRMKALGLQP